MSIKKQVRFFARGERDVNSLKQRISELLTTNHELHGRLAYLEKRIDSAEQNISRNNNISTEIAERTSERLDTAISRIKALSRDYTLSEASKSESQLLADNHQLDSFYLGLENYFRGTEEEIKKRQEVYLPYFKSFATKNQKPCIDIGCGRGEFLSLMQENGIRCIGLDLNSEMVARATEKGFEAIEGDAISYLRDQKPSSISAITGFHIVEHIPFEMLIDMFEVCYAALIKGGVMIFETPNPENLNVGANSFYMDPSHLHPIPPALLEYTAKSAGFGKVETLRLHPLDIDGTSSLPSDLRNRIYGPQDYAIIAHK